MLILTQSYIICNLDLTMVSSMCASLLYFICTIQPIITGYTDHFWSVIILQCIH